MCSTPPDRAGDIFIIYVQLDANVFWSGQVGTAHDMAVKPRGFFIVVRFELRGRKVPQLLSAIQSSSVDGILKMVSDIDILI